MVWNQKIAFRIFLVFLIVVFCLMAYFIFIGDEGSSAEKFFGSIGFESEENTPDNPAVPLPSDGVGSTGGASGSGSGSTGSSDSEPEVLRFCTFDAYHTITSNVPCRCGFSGVCYEAESVCDATFNNGEGYCS